MVVGHSGRSASFAAQGHDGRQRAVKHGLIYRSQSGHETLLLVRPAVSNDIVGRSAAMTCRPIFAWGVSQMKDQLGAATSRHAASSGRARRYMPWLTWKFLTLSPCFGNFSVAPPSDWDRRPFSGHLDDEDLGIGSAAFFPVFVRGALFSAGHGHALLEDGDVHLSAIETALAGTFEFHVHRNLHLSAPRFEASRTVGGCGCSTLALRH